MEPGETDAPGLFIYGDPMTAQQITDKIQKLRDKLRKIQKECKHPNAVNYDTRCDHGNYDPSQDCCFLYWKCPDCLDLWTEETR